VAAIARKAYFYLKFDFELITALVSDITIHKNGTLVVAASAKSLLANNIWIHVDGKLRQTGSYLKIWATSINRFGDFLDPIVVAAAAKIAPPWALQQ
jgi:hypothetical protein